MADTYIVICLDIDAGGTAAYVLATRQTFATADAAQSYAATVAQSRTPLVVAGRWAELRQPKKE